MTEPDCSKKSSNKKVFNSPQKKDRKKENVTNVSAMSTTVAANMPPPADMTQTSKEPDAPAAASRPATRAMVTEQMSTGQSPALTNIRYLICFNADVVDPNDHATNWRCLDGEELWSQIDWVSKDHAMTQRERVIPLSMTSTSLETVFGRHKYRTFCRVEEGKLIDGALTTYNLL